MNRAYFQLQIEQLDDLVIRMKASVQWQRLFIHEAQGNAAFGHHFYESEARQQAHLEGQLMAKLIRLYQELHNPLAELSDKERSGCLRQIKHLWQQVCWLDTQGWGY